MTFTHFYNMTTEEAEAAARQWLKDNGISGDSWTLQCLGASPDGRGTWVLNTTDWNDVDEIYDFALNLRVFPTPEGIAALDAHMPEWVSIEEDWSQYGDTIRCIHTVRGTIEA